MNILTLKLRFLFDLDWFTQAQVGVAKLWNSIFAPALNKSIVNKFGDSSSFNARVKSAHTDAQPGSTIKNLSVVANKEYIPFLRLQNSSSCHCFPHFTIEYILIEIIKICHIHLSFLSIITQSTISYIISSEFAAQKVSTPAEVVDLRLKRVNLVLCEGVSAFL